MIIDCHTHCYSAEVAKNPRKWALKHSEPHWADLVAPDCRKSIQDWATPEKMLQDMNDAGVDKAILLGWYWENESTCRWHNEVISDWCEQDPERFIGFASIYPNGDVVGQLERAKELGLCGAGELHPGVQGFDSGSTGWKDLATWCDDASWPINFHTTRPVGDHPAAIQTPLEDYIKMAREFPSLDFVLAHWGGGIPERLKDAPLENLYYDCSASPLMYDSSIFKQIIESAGANRVLFGSDYPLRIFPRKYKQAEMSHYLHKIRQEAGLTDRQLSSLLGDNARSLFSK